MLWKHWDFILTELVFLTSDLDIAIRGKCLTMSTNTRCEDTVEHIDTTSNPLHEIFWCSDSHKISWFFLGEDWRKDIKYSVHIFFGFTDWESTYCDTWEIQWLDEFTWLRTEIIIHNSLYNTEEGLWMESLVCSFLFIESPLLLWTLCPTMCTLHSCTSIFTRRSSWCTLVEGHHDIRTERRLHIHDRFRCKKMFWTIEIAPKMNSFFGDFCEFFSCFVLHTESEWEYLESSRVSKYRKVYIHELMQSTEWLNHFSSRTEITVVVVHEHDLSPDVTYLVSCESLERTASPNRHEYRSMDISVRRMNHSCTSVAILWLEGEWEFFEFWWWHK